MVYVIPVPPELNGPYGRQYVSEGSPLTRNFTYRETLGLPPPHSYTWLLDGQGFHGNARVKLLDGNRTLSVTLASREDTGNYTLTVESGSGRVSRQLDLLVTCM